MTVIGVLIEVGGGGGAVPWLVMSAWRVCYVCVLLTTMYSVAGGDLIMAEITRRDSSCRAVLTMITSIMSGVKTMRRQS